VLDNLGDTVMTTPLIEALKSLNPDVKIGFWVKQYAKDLFQDQPGVDRVHASDPFWDTAPGRAKGGFFHFIRTLREIRSASYDTALILNTEWRRALATYLIGIPARVGYKRRSSTPFLSSAFTYTPGHIVDDHLKLLSLWTGKNLTHFFPSLSVDKLTPMKTIVVHPFSGDPLRKNWPLPMWKQLIENLLRVHPNHTIAVLGAHNDENDMKSLAVNERVNLLSERPLKDVLSLLSRAELFVGGDSGPGHMAAAVGTPVLSLFGSFNPERCRPRGKGKIEVLKKDPLKELPVLTVEKKILEMLG
jgi:ADP-heptose:LPS heptosyltransferase